jgi:preprotein translocase subunit YajC
MLDALRRGDRIVTGGGIISERLRGRTTRRK